MSTPQKHEWACIQIVTRGETGFFGSCCWGLATYEKMGEQWLVKNYRGLHNLGYLPGLDEFTVGKEGDGDESNDMGKEIVRVSVAGVSSHRPR